MVAIREWFRRLGFKRSQQRSDSSYVQATGTGYGSLVATAPYTQFTEYGTSSVLNASVINNLSTAETMQVSEARSLKDVRIEKKPVEVVEEIVSPKPVIQTGNIKEQIRVVSNRLFVLKKYKGSTTDEELALKYLNARLKYDKYEGLFFWAVTTDELVNKLTSRYKLRRVSFGSYSRNVPMEAVEELEKYGKAFSKVTTGEPKLELIVDEGGKETRKDPILLAESPFGKWFYILGAWDKEVKYVDDIVYKGK